MEQWEKDLRAKLEDEVEPGCYDMSGPGYTMMTGKGGYIDCIVELERAMRESIAAPDPNPQPFRLKAKYAGLSEEELEKVIKGFFEK